MDPAKQEVSETLVETRGKRSRKNFPKYDFDVVLSEIGSLGRYQLLLVMGAYYVTLPTGMNQVASVFLSAIPDYRCRIPEIDDNMDSYIHITEEGLLKLSTPFDSSKQKYDECYQHVYINNCTSTNLSDCFRNETSACTHGYVFDKTTYESTIVTEWDLVCEQLFFGTLATMIYYSGVFVGAPLGGNFCDRFGRTRVMIVCHMVTAAVGIACSLSPNLATFTATRFVIALLGISSTEAAFVYMIEITGDKARSAVGISIQATFALGYMILSGLSYRWRNWRQLQFSIAMFSAAFILIWIFLPESPRWLFSNGQIKKGKRISEKIARRNNRKLSPDIWDKALVKDDSKLPKRHYYPHVLFKRPRMRKVTLTMMFLWFVAALVYYGLALNIGSLAGDDRVNNLLAGVCEILSCPMVILTMDRFGRRPVLFLCFLVGGIVCILSTMANHFSKHVEALDIVGTCFALIGKLAISGAFGVIYNYSAELFPTVIRGTAIGCGSLAARIGSILSPAIIALQYIVPWVTGVIFGIMSMVAAGVCLFLPETNGVPLTTTLDEAEAFYACSKKKREKPIKSKAKDLQKDITISDEGVYQFQSSNTDCITTEVKLY